MVIAVTVTMFSVEKVDEIKLIFLEEEIKEVKKALREEKNKNLYLTQMLEKAEREKQQRM